MGGRPNYASLGDLENNGHTKALEAVKTDQRDLRQLVMDEFRALRIELKHIAELCKLNGIAADTILAELRLKDEPDE